MKKKSFEKKLILCKATVARGFPKSHGCFDIQNW